MSRRRCLDNVKIINHRAVGIDDLLKPKMAVVVRRQPSVPKLHRLRPRRRDGTAVRSRAVFVEIVCSWWTSVARGDMNRNGRVDKRFLKHTSTRPCWPGRGGPEAFIVVPVTGNVHVHLAVRQERHQVFDGGIRPLAQRLVVVDCVGMSIILRRVMAVVGAGTCRTHLTLPLGKHGGGRPVDIAIHFRLIRIVVLGIKLLGIATRAVKGVVAHSNHPRNGLAVPVGGFEVGFQPHQLSLPAWVSAGIVAIIHIKVQRNEMNEAKIRREEARRVGRRRSMHTDTVMVPAGEQCPQGVRGGAAPSMSIVHPPWPGTTAPHLLEVPRKLLAVVVFVVAHHRQPWAVGEGTLPCRHVAIPTCFVRRTHVVRVVAEMNRKIRRSPIGTIRIHIAHVVVVVHTHVTPDVHRRGPSRIPGPKRKDGTPR
eukprot:m.186253 g.186253  ORF g.186253 m.186253 type:complete len:422 (-) comp16712_c0_seq1:1131-2396(-)